MGETQRDTVLVTGAGGFLGGRVVEMLSSLNKWSVRAGIHRWANAARIGRYPVDIRTIDVLREDTLASATRDVKFVVNCAHGSPQVNVDGTKNLLSACRRNNVDQMVHISTIEVYNTIDTYVTEESNRGSSGNNYGDSKLRAERLCANYGQSKFSTTILRPTIIYGPFGNSWSKGLAKKILHGPIGCDTAFDGYVRPVYVDDVVESIVLSLGNKDAYDEAFNIGGPTKYQWYEFFETFSELLNHSCAGNYIKSKLYALGCSPVRILGQYMMGNHENQVREVTSQYIYAKTLARKAKHLIETTPSLQQLDLFKRKQDYSISKADKHIGYTPSIDIYDGLRLTVSWLYKYTSIVEVDKCIDK